MNANFIKAAQYDLKGWGGIDVPLDFIEKIMTEGDNSEFYLEESEYYLDDGVINGLDTFPREVIMNDVGLASVGREWPLYKEPDESTNQFHEDIKAFFAN